MTESLHKTPIVIVAPKLGALSEVWLYRQASKMAHVQTVACSEHLNQRAFPVQQIDVQHYPQPVKPSRSKLAGHIAFLLEQFYRNFIAREFYDVSETENRWWCDFYRRHQNSTILFHYGVTAAKFAPLAIKNNVRFGIHFNGYDLSLMLRHKLYVARLKQVAADASLLVVVADYMKQSLISLGIESSKIRKIPYGVPLGEFECARLGVDNADVTFLMVGRLTAKKHPVASIRAFGLCEQQCPNVKLRIIGDGQLENQCKKVVSELGLDKKIIFHGSMPSNEVRTAMCESDVFVQHSVTSKHGDKEGWPVAIAEAAASGLPIVSTLHASIPEQVVDGETGFLVEEGDWSAMGRKMAMLASDHDLRYEFGRASRKHISQWDANTQIEKLAAAIQEVSGDSTEVCNAPKRNE